MAENLDCMICLDVADTAMETNCCHQLFCAGCVGKLTKCPNCRANLSLQVAHFARRLIGQVEVTCGRGCGLTLPRSELAQHEVRCPRRQFPCPAPGCSFTGPRAEYLLHLTGAHGDELVRHADRVFKQPTPSAPPEEVGMFAAGAAEEPPTSDPLKPRLNARGIMARLGSTGKFYCGGSLGQHGCECCNGQCGPSSGCNCPDCMFLDVQTRHLPKTWLVNRQGAPCRIPPHVNRKFYCGRRVLPSGRGCDGYCGPDDGQSCSACRSLKWQASSRYARIYRR